MKIFLEGPNTGSFGAIQGHTGPFGVIWAQKFIRFEEALQEQEQEQEESYYRKHVVRLDVLNINSYKIYAFKNACICG